MKYQALVSTMNQKNEKLIEDMNLTNAVIVNQTNIDGKTKLKNGDKGHIKWINSTTIGLSKSRNIALKNSTADICAIADDDLVYVDNIEDIILEQHRKHPEYDIITFKLEGINKPYKKYKNKERSLGKFGIMRISSVEITFKRKSIVDKNIKFNELFGSGSTFYSGEENIFLNECLKNNLKIKYIPIKIADIFLGNSSWFSGYNEKYFHTKGAYFYEIYPYLYYLFILRYAFKYRKKHKAEISLVKSIHYMFRGKNKYKIILKGQEKKNRD